VGCTSIVEDDNSRCTPGACFGEGSGFECVDTCKSYDPFSNDCVSCVQTSCTAEANACYNDTQGTGANCTDCLGWLSGFGHTTCAGSIDLEAALWRCMCGG
jgi:hypothetical protein